MEEKEALINAVREYPILWDFTHPEYKKTGKAEQAWEAVSNAVDISDKEARAKWKNLRDTWVRRKREYEEEGPSGSATKNKPPTWPFWEIMGFLKGVGTNRGTTENTSTNDDDDVEIVQQRKKKKQAPRKKDKHMQLFEEATTVMRGFIQQGEEDADDVFARSVALALKDLDLPCKLKARNEIQSVLTKYQLEQCAQNSPATRRIVRPLAVTPKKGGCSPKGRASHPSSP